LLFDFNSKFTFLMNYLYILYKQEMQVYPYVLIIMDQFVVLVVNYVMLVHNHHLNIDYNQVDIKHKLIVVNIVHQFVDKVLMLQ
jgi:hypothetical protein